LPASAIFRISSSGSTPMTCSAWGAQSIVEIAGAAAEIDDEPRPPRARQLQEHVHESRRRRFGR
jgi:hypothetical protein